MTFDPEDFNWRDADLDERREAIAYIRARITPLDVAYMIEDLEVHGDKIRSPYSDFDETPSCHLYQDHFWDYSTGKGGDVIDLYQAICRIPRWKAVYKLLEGGERIEAEEGRVVREVKPELKDFTWELAAVATSGLPLPKIDGVPPAYLEYGLESGYLKVDEAGNLLIPHWQYRSLVTGGKFCPGVKVRYAAGGKGSWSGSSYTVGLYGAWRPNGSSHVNTAAVICEGESDSWAMSARISDTADVYALPSGAGLWRDEWLEQLAPYIDVYICFDNDTPGRNARDKVTRAVGWGRAHHLDVPQLYNDVREACAAGWIPRL